MDTLNPDALLTATQAARYIDVTKHVIYRWVSLGHLHPEPGSSPQRFRIAAVRAAERATRQSPNSHRRVSAA